MSYNNVKVQPVKAQLPLYQLVMQRIVQWIGQGQLKAGQYLPNEWQLAEQFDVSQGTVRKGLNELVTWGLLQRYQGIGTCVTHKNWDWGDYPLMAMSKVLMGKSEALWPMAEILSIGVDTADAETARQLHINLAEAVWKIRIVWRHGCHLIALDEAYLPMRYFPDLNVRFLHQRSGLYAFILHEYGILLHTLQQYFWQQCCTEEQLCLLKTQQNILYLHWGKLSKGMDSIVYEWRRRCLNLGELSLQMNSIMPESHNEKN
ncbi:GntR family transcriptional regulator [Neisseriaceae bacterium ESL0693]|nr:GntR family transcriptional regulator [Neisseriaceae bacterium ESL0693]